MTKPLVIIISGPPCTGKTHLGLRIAREFSLPFINKDGIKERLFDGLGWKDAAWSKQLSHASYRILYYFMESLLAAGCSLIVESNFDPAQATAEFLALKRKHEFEPFQIQCIADGEVLIQRFKARAEAGERHPGHADHLIYEGLKATLRRGRLGHLDIGGRIIEVDTTDFSAIRYDTLFAAIRAAIKERGQG